MLGQLCVPHPGVLPLISEDSESVMYNSHHPSILFLILVQNKLHSLPRSHSHSPPLYTPLQRLLDPSHHHTLFPTDPHGDPPLVQNMSLHSPVWNHFISEAACTCQRVTDADSFFYELLIQKILLVVRQNARWLSFVSVLFLPMKQKEFCGPQHIGCKYIPHDVRLDMKYSLIYFL